MRFHPEHTNRVPVNFDSQTCASLLLNSSSCLLPHRLCGSRLQPHAARLQLEHGVVYDEGALLLGLAEWPRRLHPVLQLHLVGLGSDVKKGSSLVLLSDISVKRLHMLCDELTREAVVAYMQQSSCRSVRCALGQVLLLAAEVAELLPALYRP